MKIAVIGCGHMGCALLAGLLKSGISDAHLIPIDPDERVRAQLVISVAAGIRIAALARWLGGYSRIVRAMPNLPASIGLGITGLAALPSVREADRACAERILSGVGQIVWCLDEDQLDALTALCGSGPAYVFYFIEA